MGRKASSKSEKQSGRKDAKASKYRFKVGYTVLCRTNDGWEAGTIIKLDYQNPGESEKHPYQVELDNGRLIFCPYDEDTVVKTYRPAWWEAVLKRDDLSDAQGVEMLKKHSKGQDVNAKNQEGDGALHTALGYQWIPGVEAMLSLRADPNSPGNKHSRPLNLAVSLRFGIDVVQLLLHEKADPCAQDQDPEKDDNYTSISFEEREWHRSALHYAAGTSLNVTRLLIQERADINQKDAQCKQPLHLAIEEGIPGTIDLLLQSKADLNTGNTTMGMVSTPLIEAAYRSDIKLLEALLVARSDVNHQGKQGMTALHMALRGRHVENAKLLLDAKADVNIKVAGKTAAHLASKNGITELTHILDPHGEDPTPQKVAKVNNIMLDAEFRKQLYLN